MAENEPMTFQVNQFLKKAEFDGKKVKFIIKGNNPGGKILIRDIGGNLEKNGSFGSLFDKIKNREKESIANNLQELYEGLTLSYAEGSSFEPFIPFSKDSNGCINSLFYNGIDRGNGEGEGDIFIDCSYTKFFFGMKEKGVYRYLQNISGFIGSAERRYKLGFHPSEYRPKKIEFKFKKNQNLYKFPSVDICYLVNGNINRIKNYCVKFSEILKKEICEYEYRFGAIFCITDKNISYISNKHILLSSNINEFKEKIENIKLNYDNEEETEDWGLGYKICNKMNWENEIKILIYIDETQNHITLYQKLENLIEKCPKMNINIIVFKIGSFTNLASSEIKQIYKENRKTDLKIIDFNINRIDLSYFNDLLVNKVNCVTV